LKTLAEMDDLTLSTLSDEQLLDAASQCVGMQEVDEKEFALYYYKPANADIAKIHDLTCGTIGIFGGNGSGKTEHALVEGIIRATGIIPESLKDTYPRQKLRGPINMRVVCESLTTVLDPIILPKLQYWQWNGIPPAGGPKGHYGWIPKQCLLNGSWTKSYDKRTRILRVKYFNEDGKEQGWSSIQFMSYDQDASDFASGDVHYCLHDEPPTLPIWNENRARVMRGGTGSTILVSMTWPDNPAIPVDWIFDKIYDKGLGPDYDPDVAIINIQTTRNPHLDQNSVAARSAEMTQLERDTRIFGKPIRFTNRIHPLFTDQPMTWCYECGRVVVLIENGSCFDCGGTFTSEVCHVENLEFKPACTAFNLLDPHPRKPHMLLWCQLTPNEDIEVIAFREVEGGSEDVRDAVQEVEQHYRWAHIVRIMDPNMGASPSNAKSRDMTWQKEFDDVGLHYDLGDDSDVGRQRINDALKPDSMFFRPRLVFDTSCTMPTLQMKRYVWADYKNQEGKDQKQVPKKLHDDYPTLLKYLYNYLPTTTLTKDTFQTYKPQNRGQSGYKTKVGHAELRR
ncbi:MAG: hypothetical protein L0287_12910, partial [Anaerolineae bacterium]|nr:hypothetical protein [Anaerolineae bacterium]